jgi:hypothetical protein
VDFPESWVTPLFLWVPPLFLSVISLRSGVTIEGNLQIGWCPRSLERALFSAAVLRSERGKRLEVRGGRQNVKCQREPREG